MTQSQSAGMTRPSLQTMTARIRAWFADGSDRTLAQRIAGAAFLIRVASAAILYGTQVLLARWMGRFEFGIYVYVWAWVGLLGMLSPLGVAYAAQRFIPEYRTRDQRELLRGYLRASRWLCLALGTMTAALLAGSVWLFAAEIAPYYLLPFMVASLALPIFAVGSAQDSIARAFNWIDLALIPSFIVHPLIVMVVLALLHFAGVSITGLNGLITASVALWAVISVQLVLLNERLKRTLEPGPRRYEMRLWLKTALPIFLVDGFFILLTYIDLLVLQAFVGPGEVAVYYAATKTLALVNFVYFAVAAASAHRFSEYYVAGDRDKLAHFIADTTRWTFWPSLVLAGLLLLIGKPILSLFGPGFDEGYPLIWILIIGLIARASVGPSERLLNMTGQQAACALVYAFAFLVNLTLCLILIPRFGLMGAASSTASAVLCESVLLFSITKRRLGLHIFIIGGPTKAYESRRR